MLKKFLFCFSTLALATTFAASTYKVTLFGVSTFNGKTLSPGDYKMRLIDGGVVLKNGKDLTEAPAKTEMSDTKYSSTRVRYNDKHEVEEICIGGTKTKVVFNTGAQSAVGASTQHPVRAIVK